MNPVFEFVKAVGFVGAVAVGLRHVSAAARMRKTPLTDHPARAWQIIPWLQIHGITCHPYSRDAFFSSLLKRYWKVI
jgi:hypothetical protein